MESIGDREQFKERLPKCSKEQLIELITDYADQFVEFERYVLCEISESTSPLDVYQEFFDNYIHFIDDASTASVDVLYSSGLKFIKNMEKLTDSVSKVMAYLTVINEFDKLLSEGLGCYEHDEWLIEQLAGECMKNIKSIADRAIEAEDKEFLSDILESVGGFIIFDNCLNLNAEWVAVMEVVNCKLNS